MWIDSFERFHISITLWYEWHILFDKRENNNHLRLEKRKLYTVRPDVVCHKAEDEALVRNRGMLSGPSLERGGEGASGSPKLWRSKVKNIAFLQKIDVRINFLKWKPAAKFCSALVTGRTIISFFGWVEPSINQLSLKTSNVLLVKFIYSEKATKFCEIFALLLSYVSSASQK